MEADSRIANNFKADEELEKAAALYEETSNIFLEIDERQDASRALEEAVNIYRATNPAVAIPAIKKYQDLIKPDGNARKRNQLFEQLAALYEQQGDLENASQCYAAAASGRKIENSVAIANKSFDRHAELLAQIGKAPADYHTARDIFMKMSRTNIQDNILKYGVKTLLFKAGRKCELLLQIYPTDIDQSALWLLVTWLGFSRTSKNLSLSTRISQQQGNSGY